MFEDTSLLNADEEWASLAPPKLTVPRPENPAEPISSTSSPVAKEELEEEFWVVF